jgi:outer membrane protein assembly factor BamB
VGDDRVFLSKGYGQGSALLRLSVDADGRWSVEELWRNERALRTKLTNVAIRDGYTYGLSDGILECVKLDSAVGESVWKRGRYQNGQILLVGDTLLVMSETGTLAMVDAVPDEYRELDQFKALDGKCWNTLCLYGPYLLVRNNEEAACYELPLR